MKHKRKAEDQGGKAEPFPGAVKNQVTQHLAAGPLCHKVFHQALSHPPFPPGNRMLNKYEGRPFVYLKHNNIPSLLHLRLQLMILLINNSSELREQQ